MQENKQNNTNFSPPSVVREHNHEHNHHDHSHGHHHDYSDVKNIKTAFFLNLFFTLVEIVGGFFTNSIAIISDAIHDLGDCLSLGLAWYFQKVAKKEATPPTPTVTNAFRCWEPSLIPSYWLLVVF